MRFTLIISPTPFTNSATCNLNPHNAQKPVKLAFLAVHTMVHCHCVQLGVIDSCWCYCRGGAVTICAQMVTAPPELGPSEHK